MWIFNESMKTPQIQNPLLRHLLPRILLLQVTRKGRKRNTRKTKKRRSTSERRRKTKKIKRTRRRREKRRRRKVNPFNYPSGENKLENHDQIQIVMVQEV